MLHYFVYFKTDRPKPKDIKALSATVKHNQKLFIFILVPAQNWGKQISARSESSAGTILSSKEYLLS